MDYLARREHSFHELSQKLARKYPEHNCDELILPTLRRLKEENLQSDHRFTESYVRHRRNNGFGPLKIEYELNQKGVSSELIKTELYNDGNDWRRLCRQTLTRRFPETSTNPNLEAQQHTDSSAMLKDLQRKQRFLLQRGFSSELIRLAIKPED